MASSLTTSTARPVTSLPDGEAVSAVMTRRFEGKTVVVTGGAAGIGAATALRLGAEGATVVVADIADGQGDAVCAQIVGAGGTAHYVHTDVSSETAWAALAARTHELTGPADVVFSNAFILRRGAATDIELDDWNAQIAVNLTGLYLAARTFMADLVERRGSLIASSSVHALFGLPGHPAYAASKGAICALVRQLAVEYGPAVRVNAVLPGPIRTQLWDDVEPSGIEAAERATALNRLGTAAEVASAVAFLASDDASYITGANLLVDGGWSISKDSP
jgi:NAD(P)-dependent dehydrogenase (short-subunit alcohol dehydrogenase family)